MSYDQNDSQSEALLAARSPSASAVEILQPGHDGAGDAWRSTLGQPQAFVQRHVGPTEAEVAQMLSVLGYSSLGELMAAAVPTGIRLGRDLDLVDGVSEHEALAELAAIAHQNQIYKSYIGLGYSNTHTPPVIQRNILENPGWYTQYTPYQPEIAQGRLEALLNYQTMVTDLTGLEIANASLLDEGTAAAEAMTMSLGVCKNKEAKAAKQFWVSAACHPQTIEVVKTRALPLGVEVIVGDHREFAFDQPVFGVLLQYPASEGQIFDYTDFVAQAHEAGALVTVAADLLSLTLLKAPGEFGADIAVGNTQRFGVPLGYGGPHAAYFATHQAYARKLPGRLVGVSKDAKDQPALRLTLQTREQHIRRDSATSNICTAQVLLAIIASSYAVYHGPQGLKAMATRVHKLTAVLSEGLNKIGFNLGEAPFFDTLRIETGAKTQAILARAAERQINLRQIDGETLGLSLDETTTPEDVETLLQVFAGPDSLAFLSQLQASVQIPASFQRTSEYLTHPTFNRYHSETELLRYLY
ncbi:MAG: glycine dehydrogenase (aminomethyl-transferring), partial [Cyanobacteria bacterium P01_A01_bin.105]